MGLWSWLPLPVTTHSPLWGGVWIFSKTTQIYNTKPSTRPWKLWHCSEVVMGGRRGAGRYTASCIWCFPNEGATNLQHQQESRTEVQCHTTPLLNVPCPTNFLTWRVIYFHIYSEYLLYQFSKTCAMILGFYHLQRNNNWANKKLSAVSSERLFHWFVHQRWCQTVRALLWPDTQGNQTIISTPSSARPCRWHYQLKKEVSKIDTLTSVNFEGSSRVSLSGFQQI